ncbi:MAG: antibiotic biosynthesis monooxygenase family protein [Salinimicrobium sediminis]|nr:antibiotic biosynthesis monooxygenase family protein [Salinimicrobium sediminis]
MIIRIVKMTFEPSKTEAFQELFQRKKEKIRGFKGCEHLELYRDKNNKSIFFTYSYWQDEAQLENYRNSALFEEVWSETKQLFSGKPEAWSVDRVWSSGSVGSAQ